MTACGEPAAPPPEVIRPVKTFTVGSAGSSTVEYSGTLSAAKDSELSFEVPGRIVDLPISEGDEVAANEVLARLDSSDFDSRLASAKADFSKAQADFARGQALRREDAGAIAQVTLDGYKRALDVARAGLTEAEKAVENTVLRAPFAGRIGRKYVDQFSNVQSKQAVALLQDDSGALEIKVNVPESDVVGERGVSAEERERRLEPRVVVTSLPDRVFPARIKSFTPTADATTRTFSATLVFERPKDVEIYPGMTATVIVKRPSDRRGGAAFRIPAKAARADSDGQAFVWKVDGETLTVTRQSVELGSLVGDDVEVVGGLDSGDEIAVSGVHVLRQGMEIRRFGE